ncbi:MAG TPA: BamA/TamA family outer membrane protein [Bacteroidota bacterium]|nr:BamA/TamA family outer membrane protein [Bacteroidota bacterium]
MLGIFWSAAFGQDTVAVRPMTVPDSVFVVANVAIFGNNQTKAFVILREMSLREGTRITRQQIEYDRNRIYSLGLFNQVEIGVVPAVDSMAMLVVTVHERWYIFPYPIFGLKDRDWSKAFYGFGILHNNFLGRNEKIYTSFVFGYDPSIKLTYRNPFLSEEGKHFLTASVAYSKIRNRSLLAQAGTDNFDERHYSAGLTVGQRMGIAHTVWLSLGYESVSVTTYQPGRTLSPEGEDRFPIIGAGYAYDSRDLLEYPSRGSFAQFTVTKFGFPGNLYDVVRYATDLRHYIPLGNDFVIQGRVFGDMAAAGPTPSYNRTYFGYGERIRGHFKEVIEGEHIFGVSAELHYALLPPRYFKIGFLPDQFSVWKFGISAALFADAGSAWFRNDPFALNRFARGYGVGLHFLLPYSAVARLEYALNEVRHGEFIFDLGAAF